MQDGSTQVQGEFNNYISLKTNSRQRGRVDRALDLKSGDPQFNLCSDHLLDLFEIVRYSTPRLPLYIANWSASCQLGFLTCYVHFSCWFHWP